MIKYFHKISPEAIVMELYLIARFGLNHGDINPNEYPQIDTVCDAVDLALKGKIYGRESFNVEFGNVPTIEVRFLADFQIDEGPFDAKYGVGAVEKACMLARQNVIEIEVQELIRKERM